MQYNKRTDHGFDDHVVCVVRTDQHAREADQLGRMRAPHKIAEFVLSTGYHSHHTNVTPQTSVPRDSRAKSPTSACTERSRSPPVLSTRLLAIFGAASRL